MQLNNLPRLGDLATTIVNRPRIGCDIPGWEAYDAQFDGAYTNYHVCPAGTTLDSVDSDYLHAATVQLEHADTECTVFAELHF